MQSYQLEFIHFAIEQKVLCFGDFTLKSGRRSPYFFNSGLFNTGSSLKKLGEYYRRAIVDAGVQFDMIFGPAYKGIPLASAVSIAYAAEDNLGLPYCFDRKEEKDHGEGGNTLGAPLQGDVLLIDDVITAGTSVKYSRELILAAGANPVGIAIALDRQERGQGEVSAIEEIEQDYNMKVLSIISLENLVEFLESQNDMEDELQRIREYRDHYGTRRQNG